MLFQVSLQKKTKSVSEYKEKKNDVLPGRNFIKKNAPFLCHNWIKVMQ